MSDRVEGICLGSANMEKLLWSALCPLLSIIRGLRVANDLPSRGRAAHVGGTPPTPRPCQEAKAVVIEQERPEVRLEIRDYSLI